MIVATAGHVDHGKTTLVRALTGIDTDRLAEEQRRGMTIDLGFAYADLGDGDPADSGIGVAGFGDSPPAPAQPLGFVDVPGHERFVRNMLAGVVAIDLALLVVAADDGPMPQTREHLAILGLLGVPQLVVALTKADRVDGDRLQAARREVAALLADTPQATAYRQAPVFALAAPTGQGLPALRQHLAQAAQRLAQRPVTGHFRLAVDRSFTRAGAGRVVTGAVLSGCVQVGDAVLVAPLGTPARVRSLQAQHRSADRAVAGQRCALNLAGPGLKRGDPVRGDWVVAAAAPPPSDRLDVQLSVLTGADRPLRPDSQLQLHLGAAAVTARVSSLEGSALVAGAPAWARLLLDRPVLAVHGDPFILRDAAANRTVAGGRVVDPFGPARGRSRPARRLQLAALALPEPAAALAALLDEAPDGVDLRGFAQTRNLTDTELDALCRPPASQATTGPSAAVQAPAGQALAVQVLAGAHGPLGLSARHGQAWRERVLAVVDRWHAEQPDSLGPDEPALRTRLGADGRMPAHAVLRATLQALLQDGRLVRDGLCHRRAGHRATLAETDQAWLARVAAQLAPAGLRPPIVGELATALGLDVPALLAFLLRMAGQGRLVRVAPNRFYLPDTVAELLAQARALAAEAGDGGYDAAGYRDRTGIGRNLTVQVLEFLDRAGLTRFDGARHWPVD